MAESDDDRFDDRHFRADDLRRSDIPDFFGTPLVKETGELKTLRPFQVRAAQRLHGAFKGGFSAGYYNTVDTEEGWEPSSFVSSQADPHRKQRQSGRRRAMPEDFMDEEDMAEFGIAPRKLTITSDFRSEQRSSSIRFNCEPSLLACGLLKRLGWKEGYGIGPRISRRERKKRTIVQESPGMYNVPLPPSMLDDDGFEDVIVNPFDIETIFAEAKTDHKGLGYQGELVGGSSEKRPESNSQTLRCLPSGQAFGVGIEEDEDDVDIYAGDCMDKYDYFAGRVKDEVKEVVDELPRFVDDREFIEVSTRQKQFPDTPVMPRGYKAPLIGRSLSERPNKKLFKKSKVDYVGRGQMLGVRETTKKSFIAADGPKKDYRVDDDVLAARDGRFGKLTRTESDFEPCRDLYKMFDLGAPNLESLESARTLNSISFEKSEQVLEPDCDSEKIREVVVVARSSVDESVILANLEQSVKAHFTQWKKSQKSQPPPKDLFKAIFGGADEVVPFLKEQKFYGPTPPPPSFS